MENAQNTNTRWDVFICHASEDKDELVRPLVAALREAGLEAWYDEFSLSVGDSLRRSIDRGLASSDYGIVVLSPAFFRKEWPQKELDGLVAREGEGKKIILPVWHGISADEVRKFSPLLADRVAISVAKGIPKLVHELLLAMGKISPLERWIYVTDASPGPGEVEGLPRAVFGVIGLYDDRGLSTNQIATLVGNMIGRRLIEDVESALESLERHGWVTTISEGGDRKYYLSKKGKVFFGSRYGR